MEYNTEYKDRKWEMKTKIENITFNSFDFSEVLYSIIQSLRMFNLKIACLIDLI